VYSGFHNDTVKDTDVPQVLGNDADLTRYQSTTDTEINAIDPTVKYDTDGSLYMSFGSWFGGIWMLKLDAATGLRDYSAKYPTTPDVADAYYGTKLAGGHGNSGEGSYLLNTNGYWYLFLSYGNLQANGGYQIRMYRSQNIAGPYTDENGNTAISTSAEANNWEGENGIRLLSSYKWSGGPESIEVAQGHNSALVDKSGKTLMVYHTRFHDQGETHQIRVRELMPTADGWLVAAPYEYTGTTANTKGYETSSYSGDYELITHNPLTYFKGIKVNRKSNKFRGVNEPQKITLKKDGTVSGAVSGKWEADKGKNTMTITLDGQKYTGDFAQIPNEATGKKVMTFSALGKNICIWGSQQ
jgi:arabinan endo-1,5-alpha-L-arabinosidase